MADLDYYTVMQKRIELLQKKYDPYNRYAPQDVPEPVPSRPELPEIQEKKKKPGKVSSVFNYLFSLLF